MSESKYSLRPIINHFPIADVVSDGVRLIDLDFNSVIVNKVFQSMVGLDKEDLQGCKCCKAFEDCEHCGPECPVVRVLESETLCEMDISRKTYSFGQKKIHLKTAPVRDEAGRIVGVVQSFHDLTYEMEIRNKYIDLGKRTKKLEHELLSCVQVERKRLSRYLHDDISQSLALNKIRLGILMDRFSNEEDIRCVREIFSSLDHILSSVSSLNYEMDSRFLFKFGLAKAISQLSVDLIESNGIKCSCFCDLPHDDIKLELQELIYQIVRELFYNVVKHARARNVVVEIALENEFYIIHVEDDGVGVDSDDLRTHLQGQGRFGLYTMLERIEVLGGSLDINSAKDKGLEVRILLPYDVY